MSTFLAIISMIASIWFSFLILKKAGVSPWFTLIMLVPFVNIIAIWVFAFKKPWPVEQNDSYP